MSLPKLRTAKSAKEALKRWKKHCEAVREQTSGGIPFGESEAKKQERIAHLLSDYKAFVLYYFPHFATSPPAKFHIEAANKIAENAKLKGVFEWARGHAKSVNMAVLIPLWLKAKGELHVMVLVGKSSSSAAKLLGDLQAELENNKRYLHDFGAQKKIGDWQDGEFSTLDGCAFFAVGRGQSPRGLRKGGYRPDYILIDDMDDDEMCRNEKRVNAADAWVMEALYGALDLGRGRFIMVGNRISNTSVLAKMAAREGIFHTRVNVLDENGQPSWGEKYTLEEIHEEIKFVGYRASQKEWFNNPIVEGAVFSENWVQYFSDEKKTLEKLKRIVVYTDPSFTNNKHSDYKATCAVGADESGQLYLLRVFCRQATVTEMVRWKYSLFKEWHDLPIPLEFWMEANFAQHMLLDEYSRQGQKEGKQLPIRKDTRKKGDKFARIEAISPLFERGIVHFSEEIKNQTDFKNFYDQLMAIEKGSRTPDDGPDAFEGAVWLLQRDFRTSNQRPIGGGFSKSTNRNF